jgi:hypothetical protein
MRVPCGEIESRVPVREGADHASAPPDLVAPLVLCFVFSYLHHDRRAGLAGERLRGLAVAAIEQFADSGDADRFA